MTKWKKIKSPTPCLLKKKKHLRGGGRERVIHNPDGKLAIRYS